MQVLNWARKRTRLLRQLAGLDLAVERRVEAIEASWNEVGQETASAAPLVPDAAPAPTPVAAAPAAAAPQYLAPMPPRPEPELVREHVEPEPPQPAPAATKSLASYLE